MALPTTPFTAYIALKDQLQAPALLSSIPLHATSNVGRNDRDSKFVEHIIWDGGRGQMQHLAADMGTAAQETCHRVKEVGPVTNWPSQHADPNSSLGCCVVAVRDYKGKDGTGTASPGEHEHLLLLLATGDSGVSLEVHVGMVTQAGDYHRVHSALGEQCNHRIPGFYSNLLEDQLMRVLEPLSQGGGQLRYVGAAMHRVNTPNVGDTECLLNIYVGYNVTRNTPGAAPTTESGVVVCRATFSYSASVQVVGVEQGKTASVEKLAWAVKVDQDSVRVARRPSNDHHHVINLCIQNDGEGDVLYVVAAGSGHLQYDQSYSAVGVFLVETAGLQEGVWAEKNMWDVAGIKPAAGGVPIIRTARHIAVDHRKRVFVVNEHTCGPNAQLLVVDFGAGTVRGVFPDGLLKIGGEMKLKNFSPVAIAQSTFNGVFVGGMANSCSDPDRAPKFFALVFIRLGA